MAPKQRHHPADPPMTLATRATRACITSSPINDACRHQAVIDVSSYPGDTPVPWFRSKVKCANITVLVEDGRLFSAHT
jgi:hypothetical protein